MRLARAVASIGAMMTLAFGAVACDIIMPAAPPPGPKTIGPQDFVWANLDMARELFEGVARLDCPKVSRAFTATGLCKPIYTSIGAGLSCPLAAPAESMAFYCLKMEDVPAIYVDVRYASTAKDIDFNRVLGPCGLISDGPAAQKAARYPTDGGYRACFFESATVGCKSELWSLDGVARPTGLYLDMRGNPLADGRIKAVVDAPVGLVLDARLLSKDERQKAFNSVFKLFSLLREPVAKAD